MIICVLEYPHSGEQASVVFVDTKNISQPYQLAVSQALKDKNKIGEIDADYAVSYGNGSSVKLPCTVNKFITLYIP